jgi:exonuclease VII large subunit
LVVNSNNEVMNRLEKAKVGDMLQISVTDGDVMARVEELIMKERNM